MAADKSTKVVIIGGGPGGACLANVLQHECDVTLVDMKEYFEILWAELRCMVDPSMASRSLIYHSDYLKKGRIVVSAAANVTETMVHTVDGMQIPYDYLVIATGHNYNVPQNRGERIQVFEADNEKIKAANSILVVGGGPTGVELAAEIVTDYPGKKVTLVHRGSRLMEFVGQKASRKALDWLKSKNVDVRLNESVNLESAANGQYVTSSGETINADCHFLCIGKPWASAWLKETILKDKLNAKGSLMVEGNLRVKDFKNIFAIGDITDIPEMKQGYLAERHATLVAKNIILLIAEAPEHKLGVYKPGSDLAIVSLGRKEAVAQFPFATISGCIPGYIKSGDLFVGKTRKLLGLKP